LDLLLTSPCSLVLENDEICYNVDDLLPVCEELNIPIVFGASALPSSRCSPTFSTDSSPLSWPPRRTDYHHDSLFPSSQTPAELLPRMLATWERKGIRPKFHLSEPRRGAETLMVRDFFHRPQPSF